MLFSIHQEFYKLIHRKITWITPLIMLLAMVAVDSGFGPEDYQMLAMNASDTPDLVMIFLAVVGASMFSMEYQDNAILTLLYKASNKVYIYFSKFLVIFMYDIFLHVLAIFFTILRLGNGVNWSNIYEYHQPLWENTLKTNALNIFVTMLLIGVLFLLSSLINNNALVICMCVGLVFMGSYLSFELINVYPEIFKWNPLNMLSLPAQYYNYESYHPSTLLTNGQLLTGTILYTAIFFGLGYWVFSKKRF
jgi:ABC-2 type transport system permease protein